MDTTSGTWESIGVIHSSHTQAKGTPIQPVFAEGCEGTVELKPQFADALADLDGFERIWLIYSFDRAGETRLTVTPYMDENPHGVFATRAPARANQIGMSCVRLIRVAGSVLHVGDLDILDNTPLLDIKPYIPRFDSYPEARCGWFDETSGGNSQGRADDRFEAS